jgi:hypothetical protein
MLCKKTLAVTLFTADREYALFRAWGGTCAQAFIPWKFKNLPLFSFLPQEQISSPSIESSSFPPNNLGKMMLL